MVKVVTQKFGQFRFYLQVKGGSMYEQVAKDQVQERLEQGVASQQAHRVIAQQKNGFSFGAWIASWFSSNSIFRRPHSRVDRIRDSERVSLKTSEKIS